MTQAQGPSRGERFLRVFLAVLLAGAPAAPVLAQGAASLKPRPASVAKIIPPVGLAAEIDSLRGEAAVPLSQVPAASAVAALQARRRALEARLTQAPLAADARAELARSLAVIGDALNAAFDPGQPGRLVSADALKRLGKDLAET